MSEGTKDLVLHHRFTDRGGAEVYDAYSMDDRLGMKNKLFEIRIKKPTSPGTITETPEPNSSQVEGHGTG